MFIENVNIEEVYSAARVSTNGIVDLRGVDLFKDFLFMPISCGRGKNYWVFKDLKGKEGQTDMLTLINDKLKDSCIMSGEEYVPIERHEVLVPTSRKSTKLQQLTSDEYYGLVCEAVLTENDKSKVESGEVEFNKDAIGVCTMQKLALAIEEGRYIGKYRLIFIDELQSVISDVAFNYHVYHLLEWLSKQEKIIKVGMTGTPKLITEYVQREPHLKDKFNFKQITKDLPPTYRADEVMVYYGTSYKTIAAMFSNRTDENHKTLVFVNSAAECIRLQLEDSSGRTLALISDSNRKDTKLSNGEIVNNHEIMLLNQEKIEYLRRTELIPKGINILVCTSAYREGFNIKDAALKNIFTENCDDLNLGQDIGRCRHDGLELIVVISNGNYMNTTVKNLEDCLKFIREYEAEEDEIKKFIFLKNRYNKQNELTIFNDEEKIEKLTHIVAEVVEIGENGIPYSTYKINYYLSTYYEYMRDCLKCAATTSLVKEKIVNAVIEGAAAQYCNKKVTVKGYQTTKEYYDEILKKYSRGEEVKILMFDEAMRDDVKLLKAKQKNSDALIELKDIVPNYLDILIYGDTKEKLIDEVNNCGIVSKRGKRISWPSVKAAIEELGYTVSNPQRRVDGKPKKVWIIEKA